MGGNDPIALVAPPPRGERYMKVIAIDVRHAFYAADGEVCRDLVIAPSPQTAARLDMLQFVTRQRDDGIDIVLKIGSLGDPDTVLASVAQRFAQLPVSLHDALFGTPLLFTVTLTSSRFANFTAMPTDRPFGDPPLLLSNARTTITSGVAPDLAADLTLDWNVTVTRPSKAAHPMETFRQAIKDKAAGIPYTQPPDPPTPAPPNLAVAERNELFAKSQHFALLQIQFAPTTRVPGAGWNGFPIDGTDPTAGLFSQCRYTLRFAARQTIWRYWVAARNGSLDPSALAIVDADDGAAGDFAALPEPQTLPDGRPAFCFDSIAPIALSQRPPKRYRLLGLPLKGRRTATTLIPTLPVATNVRISPVDGQPPPDAPQRSDIYVFV